MSHSARIVSHEIINGVDQLHFKQFLKMLFKVSLEVLEYLSFPDNFYYVFEGIRDKLLSSSASIQSLEQVKALDSQSTGPVFKTTGWLQGRYSLSSFRGR